MFHFLVFCSFLRVAWIHKDETLGTVLSTDMEIARNLLIVAASFLVEEKITET